MYCCDPLYLLPLYVTCTLTKNAQDPALHGPYQMHGLGGDMDVHAAWNGRSPPSSPPARATENNGEVPADGVPQCYGNKERS